MDDVGIVYLPFYYAGPSREGDNDNTSTRHLVCPRTTRPRQTNPLIARQAFSSPNANNTRPAVRSMRNTPTVCNSPVHAMNRLLIPESNSEVAVVESQTSQSQRAAPPTVVRQGREYHIIDPKTKGKVSGLYTRPKPTNGSQLSEVGTIPTGLEVSQSGLYYNQRRYQALSTKTKDYVSLYSTPVKTEEQEDVDNVGTQQPVGEAHEN